MNRGLVVGLLCLLPVAVYAAEPDPNSALNQLSSQAPDGAKVDVPAVTATPVDNAAPTPPAPPAPIDWKDASKFVGQRVQVEAAVIGVYVSEKVAFLKFSNERGSLEGVIFKSVYGKFSQDPNAFDPKAAFERKTIRLTGVVKQYNDNLEIIIDDPSQVVVTGEQETKILNWEELKYDSEHPCPYVGQRVTVEGTIIAAHNTGKACFLNFHGNWALYGAVVLFQRIFAQLPEPPETFFLNKKIRATGDVKMFNNRVELIVNSPSDIQIVPN